MWFGINQRRIFWHCTLLCQAAFRWVDVNKVVTRFHSQQDVFSFGTLYNVVNHWSPITIWIGAILHLPKCMAYLPTCTCTINLKPQLGTHTSRAYPYQNRRQQGTYREWMWWEFERPWPGQMPYHTMGRRVYLPTFIYYGYHTNHIQVNILYIYIFIYGCYGICFGDFIVCIWHVRRKTQRLWAN